MSVDDAERHARAALARLFEPGRHDVHAAVGRYGAEAVWRAVRSGGPAPDLLPRALAGARHRMAGYDPRRDLDALARLGARQLCPGDDEWPAARLSWEPPTLEDAPPLSLHVRGAVRLSDACLRSVAVVGARAASAYGLLVARELSFALTERGWGVVSGAAHGIDGAAHTGALASGAAPTVAVLACGLDRSYPEGHTGLLRRIAETGLVVSELPVGSAPSRGRFLVRNRLIAALSVGTVAVEAAGRSGSLATVQRAVDLTRPTMAVPGPITSTTSAGTNQLLRDGSRCVTCAADVLAEVGAVDATNEVEPEREHRVRDDLSAAARSVLDAVPVRASAGIAGIARAAGVTPLVVQQVLPPLVLHGLVEQTDDGFRLTPLGAGRPARRPRSG
ncbi:MAG TPA: DNA-processing protein DprA [Mycobacteriales bacterium]|nr:DNA-processing protein DprA [Mycobacteriales bacterium]